MSVSFLTQSSEATFPQSEEIVATHESQMRALLVCDAIPPGGFENRKAKKVKGETVLFEDCDLPERKKLCSLSCGLIEASCACPDHAAYVNTYISAPTQENDHYYGKVISVDRIGDFQIVFEDGCQQEHFSLDTVKALRLPGGIDTIPTTRLVNLFRHCDSHYLAFQMIKVEIELDSKISNVECNLTQERRRIAKLEEDIKGKVALLREWFDIRLDEECSNLEEDYRVKIKELETRTDEKMASLEVAVQAKLNSAIEAMQKEKQCHTEMVASMIKAAQATTGILSSFTSEITAVSERLEAIQHPIVTQPQSSSSESLKRSFQQLG